MKIFAILVLLVSIFNIAMGGSIIFSDFKPSKNHIGFTYITLGMFMIATVVNIFKDSQG